MQRCWSEKGNHVVICDVHKDVPPKAIISSRACAPGPGELVVFTLVVLLLREPEGGEQSWGTALPVHVSQIEY